MAYQSKTADSFQWLQDQQAPSLPIRPAVV